MKKILFIIAFVTSSIVSMAQQGSWYIGGVVGISSNTNKNAGGFKTTSSSWAFAPEAGTFLKDDIQLGLALGLGGSSVKNDNGDISSSSYFSPTGYVRKFFKVDDNLSLFGGFYLNYLNGSTTSYGPTVETKQSGIGLRLGVGVAYALSPRFTALGQYGLLGYQSVTTKVGGTTTNTEDDLSFGVNTVGSSTLSQGNGSGAVFNIGIYYTFKKP